MMRLNHAHTPAMSPQEAAMLPAMNGGSPGHLQMPLNPAHFMPIRRTTAVRRGSAAGRAVLHARGVSLPGPRGAAPWGTPRRDFVPFEPRLLAPDAVGQNGTAAPAVIGIQAGTP